MHHCNSLVQSMAFTSLNTIDKNCVAVTSQGRKTSGSWGLWFLCRNPEPQRDDRRPSPRSEYNAELVSPGLFLPVNVASWYLYSSFLYFWLWMLGLPPAFRGKLCSVLSGILFWGTLVLSFNQENRFVVFFSWPYSLLSKYRWSNNCFKSWTMTSFVSRLRHFSTAVSCTMDLLGFFCFVFPFFSLCSSKLLVRGKAGVGEENVSKVRQC